MLKDFFKNNSRSIWIILSLIILWLLLKWISQQDDSVETFIDSPQKGQVYIMKENEVYAPMKIDSVSSSEIFMLNYEYIFKDAIPARKQIIDEEFDFKNHAVYAKDEIKRLANKEIIVKIYP